MWGNVCHHVEREASRFIPSTLSAAFPSISTGAYRFPIERAAEIALRAVGDLAGARAAYARALALDPENPRIVSVIADLDTELARRP